MCISDKLKRGRQLALELRQNISWLCNAIKHCFYVVGCTYVISSVVQNDTVIALAHDHSNTSGSSDSSSTCSALTRSQ